MGLTVPKTELKYFKMAFACAVQVDREKKRAAAAAAREKREQAAKSWFGWMRGAPKQTVCQQYFSCCRASHLPAASTKLLAISCTLPACILRKLAGRAQSVCVDQTAEHRRIP